MSTETQADQPVLVTSATGLHGRAIAGSAC